MIASTQSQESLWGVYGEPLHLAFKRREKDGVDQELDANSIESAPPPYTCTVYKMGHVRIKKELTKDGMAPLFAPWKKRYLKLWGTMLTVHSKHSCDMKSLLYPIPLQNLEVGAAADFTRHESVLRIRTESGEQYVINARDVTDMVSWIEHLQASVNISSDLDSRIMPTIHTTTRTANYPLQSICLQNGSRTIIPICLSRLHV